MASGLIRRTLGFLSTLYFHLAYHKSVKLAFLIKLLIHYTKGTIFFYVIFIFSISNLFNPFKVSFSSFLHSTGALSINLDYLKFEDGTPIFIQIGYRITLNIFFNLLHHRTFTFFGLTSSTSIKMI